MSVPTLPTRNRRGRAGQGGSASATRSASQSTRDQASRRDAGESRRSSAGSSAGSATVTAPPRGTPEPRVAPGQEPATRRSRSAAAQRAYARRAQRTGHGAPEEEQAADRSSGRASFVILIIGLLTVGVVTTLWLSTQAIADSYRLEEAKQQANALAERKAELEREVTARESPVSLAERARAMGMVPAGDTARLVVRPDGTVTVVGKPKPAKDQARNDQSAPPNEAGRPDDTESDLADRADRDPAGDTDENPGENPDGDSGAGAGGGTPPEQQASPARGGDG